MSSDLISREAVLKEICRDCHKPFPQYPEHGCPDPCYVYGGVCNLPAVDAVELPCRIGDTVWTIRYFHSRLIPQEGTVSEMYFARDMKLHITVKYVGRGLWGETVFATREEAEAAINKMEEENE